MENAPIDLKMGKNVPYGICYNFKEGFFYILLFYDFTAPEMCKRGQFLGKNHYILPKIAVFDVFPLVASAGITK